MLITKYKFFTKKSNIPEMDAQCVFYTYATIKLDQTDQIMEAQDRNTI